MIPSSRLREIIQTKKSKICLSADMTSMSDIEKLIDKIGNHICALKIHSDIIQDFDPHVIRLLAMTHDFVVIDDRKFCDIGNTVKMQSKSITQYADFITVHAIPGQSIIDGLRENCLENQCGILLIAQMSTKDNLIDRQYTAATINMALNNKDVVSGFICQEKLINSDVFVYFAPGCQLETTKNDSYGQQYNTPKDLIQKGIDVLIIGRGLYAVDDPVTNVMQYKNETF